MKRVLVTQSDVQATDAVSNVLTEQGFEVESTSSVEEALQKATSEPWDLVILDIKGPDRNDFKAFQDVRERTAAPVIILSTTRQDEYIVKGLDAGADDYLIKPISAKVFLARVFAILRRCGRMREERPGGVFKQGDLVIDFDRYEVSIGNKPVQLTASEFRLLGYLAKNAGKVLSNPDLVREVQGYDASPREAGEIIKVHIHNLRKKLGLGSEKLPYILNVRGFGYKFERRSRPRDEITDQTLT